MARHGPPALTESDGVLTFANHRWSIQVRILPHLSPFEIIDLVTGAAIADEDYCYRLTVAPAGDDGYAGETRQLEAVRYHDHQTRARPEGGLELVLRGRADFGLLGPTDIWIEHRFRLPEGDAWFEEQISLVHRFGRDRHRLTDLRFGLRKTLYDREHERWVDGADRLRLVPVPDRRRRGQAIDHRLGAYTARDLIPGSWGTEQLPGRGAEGWLLTTDAGGILAAKYSPDEIELGVADGEFVVSPSRRDDPYYRTFGARTAGGSNVCLRFGGAGRIHGCPESSFELGAGGVTFGVTRFVPFEGAWTAGYAAFKRYLTALGYICPRGFDPPLHWNELYNLGWRGGDNAPLQERDQLLHEAALAREIGAEALYLDPVWDVAEGTTMWDRERLGDLRSFVDEVKSGYGLRTSLHLMMHTKGGAEDPRIFCRRRDGSVDSWDDLYRGGHICPASPVWQEMKTERLLELARAGVGFFMFDFLNARAATEVMHGRDPAAAACWSAEHGHSVPSTLAEHAQGLLTVVANVKRAHPDLLIELHDPLRGGLNDLTPLYYGFGSPQSADEHWGFEFMWDPYMDLLSGKALSLYEYNLAYDLPLYLHIHCGQDNAAQLAFWWYASTCRHLGIGGVRPEQPEAFARLKEAVRAYLELKPLFTRGRFVGIDRFVHGHVARDGSDAVFVLFNLGSEDRVQEVDVAAEALGIRPELTRGRVSFRRTVPALSPLVVRLRDAVEERA